jgi:dethiobiotin synthetase
LIAPDVEEVLAGAAMRADSYEMHVPYRFAPACSPHLAAELAGVSIDLARIHTAFDTLTHRSDVTIVEGAGGIHVPLGDGLYTLDLIAHLGLPVIVVTTPRLGTLNHTLLTVSALRHRGLRLLGVVYNNHANRAKDFIYKDNRRTIEAFVHPAPMVEIDHGVHDGESIREFCDEIRHTL